MSTRNDHQRSEYLPNGRYGELREFPIGLRQEKVYPCAVRLPPYGRRVVLLRETDIGGVPNSERQVAEQ